VHHVLFLNYTARPHPRSRLSGDLAINLFKLSISMADIIILAGNAEMSAELVTSHNAFSGPIYKSLHKLSPPKHKNVESKTISSIPNIFHSPSSCVR